MDSTDEIPTRKWVMVGLPGRDTGANTRYEFRIGPLSYIEKGKVYLHIPEHGARDAEGRPRHPEQAEWIRQALTEHKIEARQVWWSHWEFNAPAGAEQFEQILRQHGAKPAAS